MNDLTNITTNGPVTMSSREIADLVEKRHDNVKRTIETLVERGVIQLPQIEDVKNHLGQTVQEYRIGKRDSYVIVAQLSPEFTARLVDRWQELEAGPAFNIPKTLPEALRLAADLSEQLQISNEALAGAAAALQNAMPAVEAYEQLAEAHGSMCRTEAAKHLGVPPHTLCRWMRTNMWTYRRAGTKDDLAYQAKINAGYLEHKVTTGPRPDGTEWIGTQVRITPRGLTVLAKAFPKAAEPAVVAALRDHMAKVA